MMPSGVSLVAIAAAALLAFAFHAANDFAPIDTYFPPHKIDVSVERHFTSTYYDARALFRARTHNVTDAKLYTLPLPGYEDVDLSIDVTVVPGSSARALVHISGTHGVEGFAGSGIQSALLERLSGGKKRSKDASTLVFVHALNPYGFAKLRRFNENNVDLNRNFLTPEEFKARIAMDPNQYGYMDVMDVLNPQEPVSWSSLGAIVYGALRNEFTYGSGATKRAVVSGNYHFPKTIFYGGDKQQASGALLQRLLEEHLDYGKLQKVGVIDVHTGLGPAGVGTLLLNDNLDGKRVQGVFAGGKVVVSGDESDDAASGYEGAAGKLCSGIAIFLPKRVQNVCLTQEFGTAPGFAVLKALIEENAMYHHAPTRRLPYAEKLRDVFYLHRSFQWKANLLQRGRRVFDQLEAHVTPA
uniref:DUF2817 domain-containing protein n=1 Tax=Globisporangium ultimum (strain ATCC 200006 / CBS 805.95 / DAOM BR144) TaxID=431595 RepID=K3XD05_GLOUD